MAKLNDIDLATKSEEGAVMKVYHPTTDEIMKDDEGKEMWLRVLGMDSKQYRKAFNKINDRNMNRRSKRRSSERTDEQAVELLSVCIIDWNIQVDEDGSLEFSEAAAIKLLKEHGWLRDQVDEFIGERSNFLATA